MKRCVLLQSAVLILLFVFSYTPNIAHADESSCGAISAPEGWSFDGVMLGEVVETPITDCANPLRATTDAPLPYTLSIEGQVVPVGSSTIYIDGPTFSDVSFTGVAPTPLGVFAQFLHTEQGMEYVPLQRGEPQFSDYEQFAQIQVTDETTRTLYLQILQSDDPFELLTDADGNDVLDANGTPIADGYYAFLDAFDTAWYDDWKPVMQPGTYTFVWVGSTLSVSERSWWEYIRDVVSPTAHADFSEPIIYTQTVTVTQRPTQPIGASSILFLPGIMGSHLFENDDTCFGFGEQRRWFSHTDCEQLRLLLNADGSSVHDIYTKTGEEGIISEAFGINLYKSFIDEMSAMKDDGVIADFIPFPYDWRLRLDQLLSLEKNANGEVRYVPGTSYRDGLLYTTLEHMAEESYSGKVTIVAHSNGGLLAKAFLEKLSEEHDPLESKIDNLILVGTPQVGTPDAVVGLLHGTEIGEGWVVSQAVARQILNNAPMGYHLLPNEYYIDGGAGVSVDTPVVVFDTGTTTADFRARYGETINSYAELAEFVGSASGRVKPATDDLYTPEVGNDALLTYADEVGDTLAQWTPPATLHVYELAGIGMWTPKTLRYYSGEKCVAWTLFGLRCNEYAPQLEYSVYFTREGDETVVVPSALAMSVSTNISRRWLNILGFNNINRTKYEHRNMLEIPDITTFVSNIASHATDTETEYISDTVPSVPNEHMLVYHLHSPLDMYVTSSEGMVSSSTNTILGAYYYRFGEVQYIFLPADITDAVLHLVGHASGSFTLNVEDWEGEEVTPLREYRAIPSATTTQVTLTVSGEDELLYVDFDGDGSIDGTVDATEDVIKVPIIPEATSTIASSEQEQRNSDGTRVAREEPQGRVLGASTMSEEARLMEMIKLLQQVVALLIQLKHYENN